MLPAEGGPDSGETSISTEEADNLRRSKKRLRNDDGTEATQVGKKPNESHEEEKENQPHQRSYASMFKDSDFVYSMSFDSEEEDDSLESEVDSDYENDFEYSDREEGRRDLPIEYYDNDTLRALGDSIGKTLKVEGTRSGSRFTTLKVSKENLQDGSENGDNGLHANSTASGDKVQKVFHTGSEMRRDHGKNVIENEDACDTQSFETHVPETEMEKKKRLVRGIPMLSHLGRRQIELKAIIW
ncbi:hypothetical protein PIB30_088582 [Stylosanthes scabra]|uniref:Uncharacterized protein n=1 Tax=Stylosanthes scabra TaxID=79078 RepID=A0ABU6RTN9_9FABA|nr:hypothetical protein [Stylosanthes scabra]